jgi:hypothetical protein
VGITKKKYCFVVLMGSSDPKPRFVFQFYETSFKHIMRTVKDNVCDFSIHIFEFTIGNKFVGVRPQTDSK